MQTINIQPKIAAPNRICKDANTSLAIVGSFHLIKFSRRHYYQLGKVSQRVFELFTRKRV